MPDLYAIRMAQIQDLKGLSDLLAECFHTFKGWKIWFRWLSLLMRWGIYEDLKQRWRTASPYYGCWVAVYQRQPGKPDVSREQPERLAGMVEVSLRSWSNWSEWSKYPYISNLAVKPEDRHQGLAQQLLEHCEQTALKWGCEEIYLHVLENNHPARCLYYKVGYRLHQVELSWSTLLLGKPKRLFLQKRL